MATCTYLGNCKCPGCDPTAAIPGAVVSVSWQELIMCVPSLLAGATSDSRGSDRCPPLSPPIRLATGEHAGLGRAQRQGPAPEAAQLFPITCGGSEALRRTAAASGATAALAGAGAAAASAASASVASILLLLLVCKRLVSLFAPAQIRGIADRRFHGVGRVQAASHHPHRLPDQAWRRPGLPEPQGTHCLKAENSPC